MFVDPSRSLRFLTAAGKTKCSSSSSCTHAFERRLDLSICFDSPAAQGVERRTCLEITRYGV